MKRSKTIIDVKYHSIIFDYTPYVRHQ